MIRFMVVGLPRSGTTWAANWLTTERTLCIHDPLWVARPRDWDDQLGDHRIAGVACTGIYHFPDWLNAHPAPKVVLHRPYDQVVRSLARIGLPAPDPGAARRLHRIEGLHVSWTSLFKAEGAARILEHLVLGRLDADRHAQLRQMTVAPRRQALERDRAAAAANFVEISRSLMEA